MFDKPTIAWTKKEKNINFHATFTAFTVDMPFLSCNFATELVSCKIKTSVLLHKIKAFLIIFLPDFCIKTYMKNIPTRIFNPTDRRLSFFPNFARILRKKMKNLWIYQKEKKRRKKSKRNSLLWYFPRK